MVFMMKIIIVILSIWNWR